MINRVAMFKSGGMALLCALPLFAGIMMAFPAAGAFVHADAGVLAVYYEEELSEYEPRALSGRTVILDAGHGVDRDNTFMGYSESRAMIRVARELAELLEEHGARVILTRRGYMDVPLPVRAARMNQIAMETLREAYLEGIYIATDKQEVDELIDLLQRIIDDYENYAPVYFNFPFDWTFERRVHPEMMRVFQLQAHPLIAENFLMISLHSNAVPNPSRSNAHGVDVYIMTRFIGEDRHYFADYSHEERNRFFGEILIDNIDALGIERRGVHGGNWFIVREHNLPGALVENGFHTSNHDRALLMCNDFLSKLAVAYEDAILRYFRYFNEE